jgi:hypothetical protein
MLQELSKQLGASVSSLGLYYRIALDSITDPFCLSLAWWTSDLLAGPAQTHLSHRRVCADVTRISLLTFIDPVQRPSLVRGRSIAHLPLLCAQPSMGFHSARRELGSYLAHLSVGSQD